MKNLKVRGMKNPVLFCLQNGHIYYISVTDIEKLFII
mgnify:CR=1 FL=1